jgi:5-methylcytosine-specific restriction endonuclease McrA
MAAGEVVLCSLCGEKIPRRPRGRQRVSHGGKGGITVDHIIPLSRGGRSVVENLAPAHCRCNEEKGDSMLIAVEAVSL